MGLFRKNRAIEIPEPEPVVVAEEKIIKVVILTFPPNFEALTPEARNPKLVFQHESDSVVSSVSNCSCRMALGRRRPECCQSCLEMKQALSPRLPVMDLSPQENMEKANKQNVSSSQPPVQVLARSESARFYSSRCGHKVPPTLKFLSKIVSPSRTNGDGSPNSSHQRPSAEEWQLAMLTPPSLSPPPRRYRKSRSTGNFFFGKQHDTTLNQCQSLATDELSVDHELS